MTSSLRARSLIRLWWLALVLSAGCQRDCREHDDDDNDSGIEEDFYVPDGGQRDSGRPGGPTDGGGNPFDGGMPQDGGPRNDGGMPGDGGSPGDSGMDGGPADGGPDVDVDAEILCPGAPPTSTGTASAPRTVAIASLPFAGQVDWRGLAFVEITGLTAGEDYLVTLAGGADLTLLTYSGDTSFSTASCSDLPEPGTPAACRVRASSASIHVAIDAAQESQAFELDMRALAPNEAPDARNPVRLAADALPALVSAVPFEPSFYEITGLTAGQEYVISASATSDVIGLYAATVRDGGSPVDMHMGRAPQVVATATGTSLHVYMTARTFSTSVELSVKTTSYVAEGTEVAPISAASAALPLVGQVPASASLNANPFQRGRSFYVITDLEPGTHLVRMSAEPGIAMIVYGDESDYQIGPVCGALIGDDGGHVECSVRITGSSLYLGALNLGGDGSVVTFEVDDAPYASEGLPLARVDHSIIEGGIAGVTSGSEPSYYRLHDVTPRQRYRFVVQEPAAGMVAVTIYEPGHADAPLCVFGYDLSRECLVTTALTQLDVEVRTLPTLALSSNVGGPFVLKAEAVPEQTTGTASSPIRFRCGQQEHHGQVGDTGITYYEVSGLTPRATYLVEVTGASGQFELAVSPSLNTWPSTCAYGDESVSGRCKGKPSNEGKLFVRVTSHVLASFDLRVSAATRGAQGTASNPFVIDRSAMPYVGQAASSGPSHYRITGLTPSQQYLVRIVSEQETTELHVWQPSFGGSSQLWLTTPPGFPNETVWSASATEALLTVGVSPDADGVTSFSLNLTPYE